MCEAVTIPDHIPTRMLESNSIQCSVHSSGVSSGSDVNTNSSSTSIASYSTTLPWHLEDDKSVDQDDGWQVVAAKSTAKPPGQHQHHQQADCSASAAGNCAKVQVCGRCGMRGHVTAKCKQPRCSKCNKWWHLEDECSKACNTCGSLDHRVCGASLCKSYKCRECGLYGHVYAECPNIRCNLCSEIGHKALECPSIVCNICKQKGHKAVHCTQPRYSGNHVAAASKSALVHPAQMPQDVLQPAQVTARHLQLQHCSSSSSSVTSPMSTSSTTTVPTTVASAAVQPAAAAGAAAPGAAAGSAAASSLPVGEIISQPEVPLMQQPLSPANMAEQQQLQQQHSRLLGQLLKIAPDLAVACLDDSSKLQALYSIEPGYLVQLLQLAGDKALGQQRQQLEAAVASALGQLQQRQQQACPAVTINNSQLLPPAAAGSAVQRRLPLGSSAAPSPVTPSPVDDVTDATQGIKPGDLAPQHAKQLVAEFGDMLPSRWQQLPSWRQLEARLSFPDGNYVQRRLQFREKRRQLQVLTLQLRAAAAAGKQQGAAAAAGNRAGGPAGAGRSTHHTRVVPEVPAGSSNAPASTHQHQQTQVSKPPGSTPCSYAAALAGLTPVACVNTFSPCSSTSSCQPLHAPGSPFAADTHAGVAVCSRCGMMGHSSSSCAQPRCSRCHLWWHSEAQCSSACQFCGSSDHAGDAEQPASCKSFKCKACRMFGHTQSICPHVQLHNQQLQRQSSSVGSSSSSLLPPASPLSSSSRGAGTAGSSSNGSTDTHVSCSSGCPPDSPGLGQQGVKPKDLLPEHAKALQDEFPNALPSGWQQMGSWRMVEERLRVVAVEGAVFSKRRQMWRDRRKHYQALTAQALAAAARSAAAAANAAAAEQTAAAAAAARLAADSSRISCDDVGGQVAAGTGCVDSVLILNQQHQVMTGQDSVSGSGQNNQQEAPQQQNGDQMDQQPSEQQISVFVSKGSHCQQQAQSAETACKQDKLQEHPHTLLDNQHCSMDPVFVPEWQQQQGSLFGLVDPAPGSMPMDSTATGSAFSCDTHFTSSPTPASHTPTVMRSPFMDRLGFSGGSTPAQASTGSSGVLTPAANAAGMAGLQICGPVSASMSSPMPASACNTPQSTPRPAAVPASAGVSSVSSAAVYTAAGMSPVDGIRFSPMGVPHSSVGNVMRSPLGYPAAHSAPPTSPMDMHNAAAAAAAMAAARGSTPHMYQNMAHVAQRQNQLQQQLMLQQGRYCRPMESPGHQQQVLMQMQLQQQHQMKMQRQCRMDQAFLVQQQIRQQQHHQQQYQKVPIKAMMTGVTGDEVCESGELDDTLGVLGVLGLQ